MQQPDPRSLWDLVRSSGLDSRRLSDPYRRTTLADLEHGEPGRNISTSLRGQGVLLLAEEQLTAALGLIALDGIARRIVICPPGLDVAHLPHIIATAGIDVMLLDEHQGSSGYPTTTKTVRCRPDDLVPSPTDEKQRTEWILFTSGTTGAPKMVVHTLQTLVGTIQQAQALGKGAVWSTFYDIRRYGGLQILLRALAAGGSMVLSSPRETPPEFLARAIAENVTHISGTPSHWRRALMTSAARSLAPFYVRMSGEVADQPIIDALRAFYPNALVAHAFASTEAGLAFDVNDGKAGFPAQLLDGKAASVDLRMEAGSLRVRSNRTALRYLGEHAPCLKDNDGFVDTGDILELRGDRYHFSGRREGIINVGGFKVHPEEVEAVVNRHPDVQMSLVRARSSPIMGAIVVADVVPRSPAVLDPASIDNDPQKLKSQIIELCRAALPAYKVPASIRLVRQLDLGVSGKMVRQRA